MANTRISALTALAGASVDAAADVLAIVDTSVTTTKKIVASELGIALGLALKAPLASPTFTGTPVSTTAAVDTNTTQIATTAFVVAQISAETLSGISLGTEQASTSGTSIDFTGIPAGTKRITISYVGTSLSGSSNLLVQLGTTNPPETTGYISTEGHTSSQSSGELSSTAGFIILSTVAAGALHGATILSLEDASDNTWTMFGVVRVTTAAIGYSAGSKSLSGVLDRVRITTVNGSDTFDAGAINISYEG